MYQSIPKRVYTTQESAMPKIPVAKAFAPEQQDAASLSPTVHTQNKVNPMKKLETDDLLLIGLLLLLISEEGEHQLLIAVVALLLFS